MPVTVCLAAKASARTPLACSTVQRAVGPTCATKPENGSAGDLLLAQSQVSSFSYLQTALHAPAELFR